MATVAYQAGAAQLVGWRPNENMKVLVEDASVASNPAPLTGQALLDVVYTKVTSSQITTNFKVTGLQSIRSGAATYSSATPAICSVDASGNVTRVADGTCIIDTQMGGEGYRTTRDVTQYSGVSNVLTGYAIGSLAAHIAANITAMVNGKTASDATRNIYSGAVRNAGVASAGWDFSASCRRDQFPVQLISARHAVWATHVGIGVGNGITFVRNDNSQQTTTITGAIDIPGTDMRIGLLQDAISGITPYYFLPSTHDTYLPCIGQRNTITSDAKLPVINIEAYTGVPKFRVLEIGRANNNIHKSSNFPTWSSDIIQGDSSGPIVMPIASSGNKMVLVGSMHTQSGAYLYHYYLTEIQAAMDSLLGGYTMQTVALSGLFTVYP